MKTKILLMMAMLVITSAQTQADIIWDSGHHEIHEGDSYFEIYMRIDASATMFGGEVFKMETFEITVFDMLGGQMDLLYGHGNSIINIHGGTLGALGVIENGLVYLYAYDVIHHNDGGHFNSGWIEGKYVNNDCYFEFDLYCAEAFSHIAVVPEPISFFLFGAGVLFLSKKKKKNNCPVLSGGK